jgi:hypothetical protein
MPVRLLDLVLRFQDLQKSVTRFIKNRALKEGLQNCDYLSNLGMKQFMAEYILERIS